MSTRPGYFVGDEQLTLDEFLSMAGEDEVVATMHRRRWIKRGMIAGGIGVIAVGALVATGGPDCGAVRNPDEQQECDSDRSARRLKAAVFVGAGAILAGASLGVPSGKPSGNQLRSWAGRYNRFEVTPEVNEHGGGVSLSGDF